MNRKQQFGVDDDLVEVHPNEAQIELGPNGGSSFRPMSCSPGVVSPGPRVDSPKVWSRFARELRISLFLLEISENHKNQVKFKIFSDRWMDGWLSCNKARCQTNPVDQCVKQSSWLVDESRWRLKSDDSSIDPSTGTKHRESDYSLLRKLPYWNIGHNLYQANRLSVRAKRLQTPGESTLGPGEQDIGWNDRKSSKLSTRRSWFWILSDANWVWETV